MEAPTLTAAGGVYKVRFGDIGITAEVSRIYESSRGETSGEIHILAHRPGLSGSLHQTRVNMLSSPTKVRLGKDLFSRWGIVEEKDWRDIIEIVCQKVLSAFREGLPVIHLADYQASESLQFRIWPFVQERQASILFGDGDTGKSWLAMFLGYQVAIGQGFANIEAEPGGVLYLDYETDEDTAWHRLLMISAGLNQYIPDGFYYRKMTQRLADDYMTLSRTVMDKNIKFIIVDSGGPATGEPETASVAIQYLNALGALDVASLTIAHTTKNQRPEDVYPFGSGYWRNLTRWNFRAFGERDESGDLTVALKNTKANNGRRVPDRAYRLAFDEETVRFSVASPFDVAQAEEAMTPAQRIERQLVGGPMKVKDIAEATGIPQSTIATTLSRWRGKMFVSTNRGEWGLLQT